MTERRALIFGIITSLVKPDTFCASFWIENLLSNTLKLLIADEVLGIVTFWSSEIYFKCHRWLGSQYLNSSRFSIRTSETTLLFGYRRGLDIHYHSDTEIVWIPRPTHFRIPKCQCILKNVSLNIFSKMYLFLFYLIPMIFFINLSFEMRFDLFEKRFFLIRRNKIRHNSKRIPQ